MKEVQVASRRSVFLLPDSMVRISSSAASRIILQQRRDDGGSLLCPRHRHEACLVRRFASSRLVFPHYLRGREFLVCLLAAGNKMHFFKGLRLAGSNKLHSLPAVFNGRLGPLEGSSFSLSLSRRDERG